MSTEHNNGCKDDWQGNDQRRNRSKSQKVERLDDVGICPTYFEIYFGRWKT
jgi:hypothetical protein